MYVPFNRSPFVDSTLSLLEDAAVHRSHLSGDGYYTHRCEEWIESTLAVERALLVNSCTSALEMALLLLNIGPGDEVVVPSFTFVSCANVVALRGATPVFADIDPLTLSVSPSTVAKCITERTKAVMMVHYAGNARDVLAVDELCREHGIALIEDAAHAFLGEVDGRYLGTIGTLAALSFHETKNFSMGEGGALLINDPKLVDRAEMIREKGTNRKQFFRGIVDKYRWVDLGASYVASDLLAAMLWAQLLEASSIQAARRRICDRYVNELRTWADSINAVLPPIATWSSTAAHMFYVVLPSAATAEEFLHFCKDHQVGAVSHYLPLEASPFGARYVSAPCDVSVDVSARLVRLPLFYTLSDEQQQHVITTARTFRPQERN